MSVDAEYIRGYGQINNGAHRQPAELVGAPAIVWHQAFWVPTTADLTASRRSERIEAYIKHVKSAIVEKSDKYRPVSAIQRIEKGERANVITFPFVWKSLTCRVRIEVHTEYVCITSIIDASLTSDGSDSHELKSKFEKNFAAFSDNVESSCLEFSASHRFFYHEIWESYFSPELLSEVDAAESVAKNKFADIRGFITCEQYPSDLGSQDETTVDTMLQGPLQPCFYKVSISKRQDWQRAFVPDESWARHRINQFWPFLGFAVPDDAEQEPYLYGRIEYTASRIVDGRMLYVSALGPQPREGQEQAGHERPVYFFLHSVTQCERQIGRVVERLLQLGTLRLAAIIALPALKKVVPVIEDVERDILLARSRTHELIQYAKSPNKTIVAEVKRRESEILVILDRVQVAMSALSSGSQIDESLSLGSETLETRLSRSVYYRKIFASMITGLRIRRIEGHQQYDDFVGRRLGGIFGFIEAVERRMSEIKRQWGALDQLYLTTAVTLLASQIEGQQSEAKNIQRDLSRIQVLGEALLIGILTPYYLTNIFYHVLNCEEKAWCVEKHIFHLSTAQMIQLGVFLACAPLAYLRSCSTKLVIETKQAKAE